VIVVALPLVGTVVSSLLGRAAVASPARERARRLATRPARRLPHRWRAPLERALRRADVDVEPEAAMRIWLGAAATGAFCVLLLAPPLALPAGMVLVAGAPVALRLAQGRRDAKVVAALPDALELVAAELRSGGTVVDALESIVRDGGPLAADVRRVDARRRMGAGLVDALAAWPADRPAPAVRLVAGALSVAGTVGGPSAAAVEGLARSLRDRADAQAEARALSTQARLSALVVGLAPVAFVLFSAVTDPGSVGTLVGSGAGRLCLVGGVALEVLAAVWIRRLVRIEP
jgi:tight adherence protein B